MARGADRRWDRRITVSGALVAATLLLAALASLLLPPEVRRGTWLPLHLALAGTASIAIVAVLPFFSTTIAAAPPASPVLRSAAVGLVVGGVVAAVVGYPAGALPIAAGGALAFAGGIALAAAAALGPLTARRRALPVPVIAGYAVALADVTIGALLVAAFLGGWPPLVAAWGSGKVAHAWLNLLGFVSLTIAATLVHLLPTVLGTRIATGPMAAATIGVLGLAAPAVAGGMLLAGGPAAAPGSPAHGIADLMARAGALALVGGALGLAVLGGSTWRARGRWTTDAAWHRWIVGCLVSAVGWFVIAALLAGGPIVLLGADPSAWSIGPVGVPLVGGWLGLAVLGALGHLLPSIGPGTPVRHARQRVVLGRGSTVRLVALDAALAVGLWATLGGVGWAAWPAAALYASALGSTLGLIALALVQPD